MAFMLPENMAAENKSAGAVQQSFVEHKIGRVLRSIQFYKAEGLSLSGVVAVSRGWVSTE